MTKKSQRVFGVDPGSRKTGFGIIDINNNKPFYVTSGVIKSLKGDFPERLETIFKSVSSLIAEYQPKIIVIESVFVHKNAGSALKLLCFVEYPHREYSQKRIILIKTYL